MYQPDCPYRLLSYGQFTDYSHSTIIKKGGTEIRNENDELHLSLFPRTHDDNLHCLESEVWDSIPEQTVQLSFLVDTMKIWHNRLGHASKKVIQHLKDACKGVRSLKDNLDTICKGCALGKMHDKSYPKSEKCVTEPWDLVHTDLKEFPVISYYKYHYVINFLDDATGLVVTSNLRHKSEALQAYKDFCAAIEMKYKRKIKALRTDRGGEFIGKEFMSFLKSQGTEFRPSAPHVHQQNGRAERLNHTLMDKSESMCLMAACPDSWWEFSFATAVHVYNRTPMERLKWKTPIEMVDHKVPDVSYLRTFGCAAYVYLDKDVRNNKLSTKSELMTFIGYDLGSKAYKFMRHTNSVYVATAALFDETCFLHDKSSQPGGSLDKQDPRPLHSQDPSNDRPVNESDPYDSDSDGSDHQPPKQDGKPCSPSPPGRADSIPPAPRQRRVPSPAPRLP